MLSRTARNGLVLMLVAVAALTVSTVAAAAGGYALKSVQSDSMHPAISAGDVVVVNTFDRQVSPGNVIVYTSPYDARVSVTHRVITVDTKRGVFTARGDNTRASDGDIPVTSVIGTVQYAVPFAGYIADMLRHPFGIMLLVYIPALSVIVSEIRRLADYYAGRLPRHYKLYDYSR